MMPVSKHSHFRSDNALYKHGSQFGSFGDWSDMPHEQGVYIWGSLLHDLCRPRADLNKSSLFLVHVV